MIWPYATYISMIHAYIYRYDSCIYVYRRTGHQSPSRWRVTSQKLPGRFTLNLVNRLLIFYPKLLLSSKKSYFDFFFFTYKCGRGRPISKVSQMLKNVNQDLQGCPTIPHDHPMCLHHPVGAYLCVLSTTIFPYKSRKSKKKSTSVTPTSEKTSDSAFSSKVRSTKVKLEIRNSKNWLGYGPACDWRSMPDPPIFPQDCIHMSRMGHKPAPRRAFFSPTSRGKFLDLRPALDRARRAE